MDCEGNKYTLAGIDYLLRFKVQTAFAEIKHFAGMYIAVNGDIVGYERFIFIALVFPALSV
jgi:hypothetical protein